MTPSDRPPILEYQLPSLGPKYSGSTYKPSLSRNNQRSQERMLMALNSVSLSMNTQKKGSQTIILPSNKFNKLIKLIQVERHEIKSLKPHKMAINFNEQWKYNDGVPSPAGYERRDRGKRIKTQVHDQEEKWTIMRKRVQAGQLAIKFPQLALAKDSLKIAETPTSRKDTKMEFKSKSFLRKGRERQEGIKHTVARLQQTQSLDANLDITGWTMNEF